MAKRGTESKSRPAGTDLGAENTELRKRIAELERLVDAEKKTVSVLMDKAERRDEAMSPEYAVFGAAARMEQLVAARTREVEEKSAALERANAELRDLTDNLDKIVRRRTRALVASEEQLRKRNIELRRLNRMKAEFISIAAHELRTPMTSIVGYIELMLEGRYGDVSEALGTRLTAVHRNAHRLMRLMEQMLSVSRIEAGKVTLNRATTDLGAIVDAVVEELSPLAEGKGHTLSTHHDAELEVDADADKLHQVVSNLVSNAIRYTPPGGTIEVFVDEAPPAEYPGAWARLRVRDDGIGIPEELRSKIFEPFADFHSAAHHTSEEPDSAGLGLYVARGLVDLHGGLITVDSKEGEFSEFTVLLPMQVDAEGR
ncbi:MAG: HAMP domain-containing histidine kinase [Deltaproteobacteria bacterium]|nr:HAMP domain-containing histidine kinase [Deltaproteobacteria bacterium]